MTPAANRAEAIDRQGRRFGITFVAPCDARHQNVFFVVKPESMPLCVGQGTAFATSGDGVCVVKAVGRPG